MSEQESMETSIRKYVDRAAGHIEKTWPLYSFVTSNPLSGLEDRSFSGAIEKARALFGSGGYPAARQFRQAFNRNAIDHDELRSRLDEQGFERTPDELLTLLERKENERTTANSSDEPDRRLNQILEKWLSVFLDEGRSRWSMPGRENGFYRSWRELAPMDHHVDNAHQLNDLPGNKFDAITSVLRNVETGKWERIFTFHLTELPGWVGYIKQRTDRLENEWTESYPIDLVDYLAVRLVLARQLEATLIPGPDALNPVSDELDRLRRCFLNAWEQTYRNQLMQELDHDRVKNTSNGAGDRRPDAQFVFCIDTRSEIIRRHIEDTGAYETHGYAGFFGIPARREQYDLTGTVDACPPVVDPEHRVTDAPTNAAEHNPERYKRRSGLYRTATNALKKLKKNILAAFSFVELSGTGYGLGMIGRTLFPKLTRQVHDQLSDQAPDYEDVFQPRLDRPSPSENGNELKHGLSMEDRVEYAESAFRLMGWDTFAPVVVFTGHVSETVNNPFDSSLCCGACAGNSGVPNAKMLARICNNPEVRDMLKQRGIEIPGDTVFVAARHNTTTDEITIYNDHVEKPVPDIDKLTADLKQAQRQAAAERTSEMPDIQGDDRVEEVKTRASDWAQTRPEWGLAGNASFIVGPTELRRNANLDGRAFLHSYDWSRDPDGSALEEIISGPLVVCQWINHQYYFSTVDTALYGSGSKITHNPVGNFGVLQGNGGDLMGGLPLQSLKSSDREIQHEPIRLQNIIHAPFNRVERIVQTNEHVRKLIENNWIDLTVIDPLNNNEVIDVTSESLENVPETNKQSLNVR